jgi:hypothetical protein
MLASNVKSAILAEKLANQAYGSASKNVIAVELNGNLFRTATYLDEMLISG